MPDVLIQAHSASLGMTFYNGTQFPEQYRGSGFAALHGSWNRGKRTGYKVVRIIMKDGVPTGEYEDFLTGFVIDDTTSGAGRSASRKPRTARCSSRKTAAAPSGGAGRSFRGRFLYVVVSWGWKGLGGGGLVWFV